MRTCVIVSCLLLCFTAETVTPRKATRETVTKIYRAEKSLWQMALYVEAWSDAAGKRFGLKEIDEMIKGFSRERMDKDSFHVELLNGRVMMRCQCEGFSLAVREGDAIPVLVETYEGELAELRKQIYLLLESGEEEDVLTGLVLARMLKDNQTIAQVMALAENKEAYVPEARLFIEEMLRDCRGPEDIEDLIKQVEKYPGGMGKIKNAFKADLERLRKMEQVVQAALMKPAAE